MAAALPTPDRTAEDDFIAAWRRSDDVAGLVDCVTTALDAGRPQLAGRLVGLLEGRVEIQPGSALERAQAVARLLVIASPDAVPGLHEDLDRAWMDARRCRMRRVRDRVRARNQGGSGFFLDQGGPARRGPRLGGKKRRG